MTCISARPWCSPASGSRRPSSPTAVANGEIKIPLVSISDAIAAELLGNPGELQPAIDRSGKPQSRALPNAPVELRIVNAERRRALTANVIGMLEGSDPELRKET